MKYIKTHSATSANPKLDEPQLGTSQNAEKS